MVGKINKNCLVNPGETSVHSVLSFSVLSVCSVVSFGLVNNQRPFDTCVRDAKALSFGVALRGAAGRCAHHC